MARSPNSFPCRFKLVSRSPPWNSSFDSTFPSRNRFPETSSSRSFVAPAGAMASTTFFIPASWMLFWAKFNSASGALALTRRSAKAS
eukprot:CAMPEP_0183466476 /NCGR_PEP_ID=MMETSP0370-20130417/149135_1 /TAXON_ID=268820 /ORGANISM="Peridinium aciculiferum, Strain PAER-2" /LENGTH=86 /DNA_ID=CAMNT_0025658755 /DNA_START=57 /DNA_END=314 /DNA_ORIENTATION=+